MSNNYGGWKVMPEEADRDYIRIRSTQLGRKYKIANIPVVKNSNGPHSIDIKEARDIAKIIAEAPEILKERDGLKIQLAIAENVLDELRPRLGIITPNNAIEWADALAIYMRRNELKEFGPISLR